jgi:hypothetical protein
VKDAVLVEGQLTRLPTVLDTGASPLFCYSWGKNRCQKKYVANV